MGIQIRTIIIFYGHVHGIGFRDAVVARSKNFSVAGTVRNIYNENALEIDIEGSPAVVDSFIQDIVHHQPHGSRIERIEQRRAKPLGRSDFRRLPTS